MTLIYTSGNAEAASELLTASARQLQQRGQALWPLSALTPERLLKTYPRGTWRVAWQANAAGQPGAALACYCLLSADPLFWPEDPAGEALYLHKLGVHPQAQGRGLALEMLRHAAAETRELGRPFLKLDTAATRPKLRALYNGFGFQDQDERQVGPYLVVRMKLAVTD